MRARAKFGAIKFVERGNDASHAGDGAESQIPAASVSCAAFGGDFRPDESFVAEDKPAFAGLGDDTGLGFVARDEMLRPEAGVFFVGDKRGDDGSIEILFGELCDGAKDCGGAVLHIVTATAVNAIAFDARLEGR